MNLNVISDLRLYQWIYKLEYIFLSAKKEYEPLLGEYGRVYPCNLRVLDFELLQAAVYNDASMREGDSLFDNSVAFAKSVKDKQFPKEIESLATNYLNILEREIEVHNQNKVLKQEINKLITQNDSLCKENTKWLEGCTKLVERTIKLNAMLARYEAVYSQDVYYKFNLHNYQNRPILVYLKEFNDFIGIDMLVETIVDAFRIQKGYSTKVIRLFDNGSSRKVRLLPSYYTILRNRYTEERIIRTDFLCKTGDYLKVIERLLSNKYNLDVLIIVDSKDQDDVILKGSFLQYNLCREEKHASSFNLPQDETVINEVKDGWMHWKPIDTTLYTKDEAFIKLSSQKVVQNVVELSGKFANAF